jgi:exopolysaccharide biosynthesis polyprenyl glycosylphosphotransferase
VSIVEREEALSAPRDVGLPTLARLRKRPETVAQDWTGQDWQRTYVRLLIAADLLIVVLAVAAGLVGVLSIKGLQPVDEQLAALLVPSWLGMVAVAGCYEMRFLGSGTEEFKRIGLATIWLTAVVGTGSFVVGAPVSRWFVAAALPGAGALLLLERWGARKVLHARRRAGACLHRVMAVGTREDVEHLIRQTQREQYAGWRVIGACLPQPSRTTVTSHGITVPVVGPPQRAAELAAVHAADTIAVTHAAVLANDGVKRLAWDLEGTSVHLLLSPALTDIAGPRVTVRPLVGLPLLHLEQPAFTGFQRLAKDVLDRLLALLLVGALAPLLLMIAVIIKLGDHGPVLFRQRRVGVRGRSFTCLKFRSMHVDAEEQLATLAGLNDHDGVLFKIRVDPRVTAVGRWLRRTSLDELPQLFNVLSGQMSLVGPRPPMPSEVDRYHTHVHRRLLVKPGITGLWQVSGRSDLSWEESVRLDLYYVENWSPLLDLTILAKTAVAVSRGVGAY